MGGSQALGGGGNNTRLLEMQDHINELERKNQILEEKLAQRSNDTMNMSNTQYEEKMQRVIRDYLDQIQELREENDKLNRNPLLEVTKN